MSKLVPNRECGECTVCCINLRIEEENFKKQAGTPCPHLIEKKGCNIYPERPEVCRNWFCAWRYMPQLGEEWRPDKSYVLLRFKEDGLILEPIEAPLDVLTSKKVIEIIGGGIENGISMYISVPTKEGYCNSILMLNGHLKSVISTGEGYKVQNALLEMIDYASRQDTEPNSPLR